MVHQVPQASLHRCKTAWSELPDAAARGAASFLHRCKAGASPPLDGVMLRLRSEQTRQVLQAPDIA